MHKTKVRFFTIADYLEEEVWLREQSRQGLRLVKFMLPCFFVFETCEPEDVVYRLAFKNGKEDPEYMQMFEDYGWEACGSCVGWLYFRKPAVKVQADNDGEIFSDDASRVDMIAHVMKTRMLPILIIFMTCVIPNWVKQMEAPGKSWTMTVVFSLLMLLYIFLIAHCGGKLRRLRKQYEKQ